MNPRNGKYVTGETLAVDFRKWPDSQHYLYRMEVLGEDRHGLWLCAPRGTVAHRGAGDSFRFEKLFVKVISAEWWAANWIQNSAPETPPDLYVDIIQPAVWTDGRVVMVDLDLDVLDRGSGKVAIVDEDEFLRHQHELSLPG